MFSKAAPLFLAAFTVASPFSLLTRQIKESIPVNLESYAYCRDYADRLGDVVKAFTKGGANATIDCWTTSINDTYGTVEDLGNPTWVHEANLDCWINEEHVRAADIDFTQEVRECPLPQHQVGQAKDEYWYNKTQFCYLEPNTSSESTPYNWYQLDLGCWTEGEAVNGNTTWVQFKPGNGCYFPGDMFNWFWGIPAGPC